MLDVYLDGGDYETVKDGLDALCDEIDYLDEMSTDTAEEIRQHTADFCISMILDAVYLNVMMDYYDGDYESYAEILEQRNELVQYADVDER